MLYGGNLESAVIFANSLNSNQDQRKVSPELNPFIFRSSLKILPSMQRAYKFDHSFYRSKSHSPRVLANMEKITFLIVCIPIYTESIKSHL